MTAKKEQKERTHASILRAAGRLVRERGIAGTRIADVMSEIGLTVGGFYAHFTSKEALVDDAFRRAAAETRARFVRGIEEKPVEAQLEVLLKRYLSRAHRDDDAGGCPIPSVVGEIGTTAPEHRGALAESVEALAAELVLRMPPRARTTTAEGRALSSRTLALGLVALMYGGLGLARATRDTRLSDEMLDACRALGRAALASR